MEVSGDVVLLNVLPLFLIGGHGLVAPSDTHHLCTPCHTYHTCHTGRRKRRSLEEEEESRRGGETTKKRLKGRQERMKEGKDTRGDGKEDAVMYSLCINTKPNKN